MSASQIAVNSFYSDAAGIYRTLRYTAETIVGITSLTRIAKVNQRWTVFVVMRKGGSVGITGGTDLFFEGFDIIELIINQLPGIFMRTIFQKRFSLRAMGGIVLNDNRSVANIVLYQRDFTVYTINIGETVVGVVVITGTNNALKSVIGMFNLVAIAISNIGDGTVCVILGCNQRLRTYFYRFKPANRIVCKVISNASLTSVAEELGVTAAYLSTVFHRKWVPAILKPFCGFVWKTPQNCSPILTSRFERSYRLLAFLLPNILLTYSDSTFIVLR